MSHQLEDDPVKRHARAITYYEREVEDLSNARRVYLTEDGTGRLDNDDTPRMLAVAVAAKQQHEVWLRLYQR